MQDQLRKLIALHCETVANETDLLTRILSRLNERGGANGETITSSIELAHKIRGSSGSIGFHDVYAAATTLESYLKGLNRDIGELPVVEMERVFGLLNELKGIVGQMSPQRSSLYHADLTPTFKRQAGSAG